jgi:hypothetical protein
LQWKKAWCIESWKPEHAAAPKAKKHYAKRTPRKHSAVMADALAAAF